MARREDRTEAATPRHRQEVRRQGVLIQAPEVSRALGVVGLAVVGAYLAASGSAFTDMVVLRLSPRLPQEANVTWAAGQIQGVLLTTFELLVAPIVITLVAALAGGVIVNGLKGPGIRLSLDRLDPAKGLARMFSPRSLFELPMSLVKIAAFVGVGGVLWTGIAKGVLGGLLPLQVSVGSVGSEAVALGFALAGTAVVIAGADYLFGRSQFEKDVRMTREELREELRRTEGDPLVRVRIRSLMRRRARMRMMAAVARADVVITNPTHYAIALAYDPKKMAAPEVVAKGRGFIAQRIREEAEKNGVPIVERPPLAQALHRSVEVGQPIPKELFRAVAEVLALIYRQSGRAEDLRGGRRI